LRKIKKETFVSEKIELLNSAINGVGMFAKTKVYQEEIVWIKGGYILKTSEIFTSGVINSYLLISDDIAIGAYTEKDEEKIKAYCNHSCNPNSRVQGNIVFVASKDIEVDKEILVDYAFIDNENYRFKCNCKASNCRKIITGFDWQLKKLQQMYKKEYFSSYIQSKINLGISVDFKCQLDKQIKDLREKVFVNELNFDIQDEFQGNEEKFIHCCLYKNDELIAYARVDVEDEYARIGRILVKKEERGNGYGKQIIFWAETEALKNNKSNIIVHSIESALSFYENQGYNFLEKKLIEDGQSHFLMGKHLDLNN